jgi:hypothetical protein
MAFCFIQLACKALLGCGVEECNVSRALATGGLLDLFFIFTLASSLLVGISGGTT